MSNDIDIELFTAPKKDFIEHLELPDNDRIIFSGKFGMGKTSFLKHTFTDAGFTTIKNTHYEVFHLFPVNYSISSNEDILELIKYDIALELLKKGDRISIYQEDVDSNSLFIKNHYDKIITLLLSAIPKINNSLIEVDVAKLFEKLLELRETYKKNHADVNKPINEGDTLASFFETHEAQIGGLYESNIITQIIERVLVRHKTEFEQTNDDKTLENILVLDDLDRIDPDHIFRILNVFAAHFDSRLHERRELKNKFGFDKVILVCDINNIRRIFRNKFGQNVDFSGYVDKFYSSTVFQYQTGKQISIFLKDRLSKVLVNDDRNDTLVNSIGGTFVETLVDILVLLIKYDQVSIRKLSCINTRRIRINEIYTYKEQRLYLTYESGLKALVILFKSLGGYVNSKEVFLHMDNLKVPLNDTFGFLVNDLFRIYSRRQHHFDLQKDKLLAEYNGKPVVITKQTYSWTNHKVTKVYDVLGEIQADVPLNFSETDFYEYLFDTLDFLNNHNLLD